MVGLRLRSEFDVEQPERGRGELGGLAEAGKGVVGVADPESVAAKGGEVCEELGERAGGVSMLGPCAGVCWPWVSVGCKRPG